MRTGYTTAMPYASAKRDGATRRVVGVGVGLRIAYADTSGLVSISVWIWDSRLGMLDTSPGYGFDGWDTPDIEDRLRSDQ